MKNNILTIMKKECSRIFQDRRLFFTAVLMPGILIFVMYTFMGNFMGGMFEVDEDYIYQVYAVNMPDSIANLFAPEELRLEVIPAMEGDVERLKQEIENRNTDLLLVFPPDFDTLVAAFDPGTAVAPAPHIEIWSNSARTESAEARHIVVGMLNAYHHALTHRFSVNSNDLATDADIFAMVSGFLIPMLFIMLIFTSCQALAPESIAGEKERGTLGPMLVTPARRRDMAMGKILGIAVFALLGGIGSMLGTVLSMPALMGLDNGNMMELFTIADFALLLLVALSTTLAFVGALSVLSAYSKSVKEANAYATPFVLVSIVCGLASTIIGRVPEEVHFYFVPVFNSALSISSVFSFEVSAVNMAVTAAVNLGFTLICALVLAKIFNSEKIVFDK